MAETTNEVNLVVKYADEKGGSTDGQLVIDSVDIEQSRDNRVRHGIGNDEPQHIEKGNKTYTFSTTAHLNEASARAIEQLDSGAAETQAVYLHDPETSSLKGRADGMVWNTINPSSSDGGDTTVDIDADLLGVDWGRT